MGSGSAINKAGSAWMLVGDCPLTPRTTDPSCVDLPVAVHKDRGSWETA